MIGSSSTGDGPSIVWAHGMGVNRHMWDEQITLLGGAYRCITFDARGHGESPVGSRPIGIPEATEDLLAVADRREVDDFALVGASMGARTAIETVLAHPGRVRALVVSDITEQSGAEAQARLRGAAEQFERGGADALNALASGPGAQDFIDAQRAAGRDPFAGHDLSALGATLRNLTSSRPALVDLAPALRAISCPVLVVHGADDAPSRGPSRFVSETIPRATLIEIPGAGHLAALSAPRAYSDAVTPFLELALATGTPSTI